LRQRKHLNVLDFGLIEEEAMSRVRNKAVRITVVLTTIVAWLSISNHCALGALQGPKSAVAHASCHGNPAQPTKPASKGEQMPCCKVLRATLVQLANSVPAFDFSGFSLQPYFAGLILFPERSHFPQTFELDTGPPFSGSFAELVLQRSLLAHAPPSFA
jgi:hypothetical protein